MVGTLRFAHPTPTPLLLFHKLVACARCKNLSMEMLPAAAPPRPDLLGNKKQGSF
jgi:hypothetical protein